MIRFSPQSFTLWTTGLLSQLQWPREDGWFWIPTQENWSPCTQMAANSTTLSRILKVWRALHASEWVGPVIIDSESGITHDHVTTVLMMSKVPRPYCQSYIASKITYFKTSSLRPVPSTLPMLYFKLLLPDGSFLAIGSHDNNIYVYSVSENGRKYQKQGKCVGHSSFITHVDWSVDGNYLQSNSGDYEILYCEYLLVKVS